MSRLIITQGIILALLLLPVEMPAQGVQFEGRAGASMPSGIILDLDEGFGNDTGTAWAVAAGLEMFSGITGLVGFSQTSFGCTPRCELTGTGLNAGVRMTLLGLANRPLLPWVTAEALFHNLRLRDYRGTVASRFVTQTSPGFQIGGGVATPIIPAIVLSPGIRYSRYTAHTRQGDDQGAVNPEIGHTVEYFIVEVGIRLTP